MLKIYNTLGRELQEFKPIEEGQIRFYQCGPTVYSIQHIGNMRSAVMGDLIRRSLKYLGYEVNFVKNYTDVGHLVSDGDEGEDKIAKGAKREGLTPEQVTTKYIEQYESDVSALNVLMPDSKPKATEYVNQMIEMVQTLLDKGMAYLTPTAIFFDVDKFPEYTKLSGQKLEMNKIGEGHGNVTDDNKKNPYDFAIWFFRTGEHSNALQYWKSPFKSPHVENGEGFPGWHIECSAMTKELLGATLDIHMGGIEHIPTHHPNEIAQSESSNEAKFVNYWLHHEHLDIDGRKMAKSDGTAYSIEDIVNKGFDAIHLRYFFLQSHYRSKQNFTYEALEGSKTAYERLVNFLRSWAKDVEDTRHPDFKVDEVFKQRFSEALENDFNIPEALGIVWEITKTELPSYTKLATILDFDRVLGLKLEDKIAEPKDFEIPTEAKILLDERELARIQKDWKKSDELRDRLKDEFGIEVKDTSDGQTYSKV